MTNWKAKLKETIVPISDSATRFADGVMCTDSDEYVRGYNEAVKRDLREALSLLEQAEGDAMSKFLDSERWKGMLDHIKETAKQKYSKDPTKTQEELNWIEYMKYIDKKNEGKVMLVKEILESQGEMNHLAIMYQFKDVFMKPSYVGFMNWLTTIK